MSSFKAIVEAAAQDRFSGRAPHFDEYVERLTRAEEALESGDPADLEEVRHFLAYLRSFGDLFLPLCDERTPDADLLGKPMPQAPNRSTRPPARPPILF